jgi:hypothetical protein
MIRESSAVVVGESASSMDDRDRIALGAGGWLLWRHFPLRSAGFPFPDLSSALVDDIADVDDLCAGSDEQIVAWWESATARAASRLMELAQKDRVTMALLWQNPLIAEKKLPWLVRHIPTAASDRSAAYRNHERIVVRYLQRYYTKNETIGFFGPVVWASIDPEGDQVFAVTPGPQVARRQRVWFEDWLINALGSTFAGDQDIAFHLPPSLPPEVLRLGPHLTTPDGTRRRLSGWEATVVSLVDGSRTTSDIASAARASVDDVERVVAALVSEGLLSRTFDVPIERGAERALARQLRALPRSRAADQALTILAELESARAEVADAADSGALGKAMKKVRDIAETATGQPVAESLNRSADRRGLLVSLSERDVSLVVGPKLVRELSAPLSLVLASARWFCRRAGEEFGSLAMPVYRGLASLFGDGEVPLNVLYQRLAPMTKQGEWLDGIVADLERRWSEVLDVDPDAARVTRRSADLADAVVSQFDGPAPGWHAGRHHSPDIMIAARDAAAIEAGDCEFVMGELHAGMVTCDRSHYYDLARDPDLVRRCVDRALLEQQPRFVPLFPRVSQPRVTCYGYPPPEAFSPAYTYLSFGERAGERAVPGPLVKVADLAVRATPSGPVVAFPDGSCQPLLHVLGEYVSYAVFTRFRMAPAWAHHPRVTIDRLVVTRETWRVPAAELEPLGHLPAAQAYVGLCRLAARYGLPRHSYWRPARAVKPIYLDLCSPQLAELLLTAARSSDGAAGMFTFTEMYPGPQQLWLTDAQGNRYTSEIRLTLADTSLPAAWPERHGAGTGGGRQSG